MASNRSDTTEQAYRKKAEQIVSGFRARTGSDDSSDFLAWLAMHRQSLTAPSWRYYRAALAYSFEASGYPDLAANIRALGTEQCVSSTASPHAKTKQKKLPVQDQRRINERLMQSRSRYAQPVGMLIEASRLTGLRPIEWPTALIVDDDPAAPVLVVQNAKATNDRSHGPTRRLRLDGLTRHERHTVYTMVRIGQSRRATWAADFKQMQKLLYRITKRLWPSPKRKRRPTLYSGRHQFAADAKAAGLSRIEIAALMGHASTDTAAQNYGRRTAGGSGGSGFRIEPDPGDIQNVIDSLGTQTGPDQTPPEPPDPEEPGQFEP